MNDFERLNDLSKLFQERQQKYWRIGDREKPNIKISLFYTILITLIASVMLFLFIPSMKSHLFTLISFPLQILLLSFLGWRYFQFKRSMAQLNRSVIQTKDDLVSINHRHFQELIHQIRTTFEKDINDFAEFFCYIAAYLQVLKNRLFDFLGYLLRPWHPDIRLVYPSLNLPPNITLEFLF